MGDGYLLSQKIDDKNFTFEGADSRYVSCCVFMED